MIQFDELKPVNLSAAKPSIAFSAANPKFLTTFPDGSDQLWSANIKACRHGVQCDVFEGVLFVESNDATFIYGIEFEDGYPKGLKPELAAKQQAFIQFLRDENAKDDEVLGWTALVFTGHEYASEGKATAAYLAVRDKALNMGIGYRNADGKYELVGIDPAEGWLESARSIVPFDELGKD